MIIACPNCHTKYNLPDSKIPAGGAKVKCAKCAHVFRAEPPKPEVVEEAASAFDQAFDEAVSEARKPAPQPAPRPEPEPEPEEEAAGQAADEAPGEDSFADEPADEAPAEEEAPEEEPAEEEDDSPSMPDTGLNLDAEPAAAPRKKGGKGLIAALVVLLVLVLFYGAYLIQPILPFKLPHLPFSLPGVRSEAPAGQPAESPANRVKKIALRNIKQSVVMNDKAGPVFVIEGRAVNTFETPKERIKIEATLYDDKGNILASKQVLCGNTLSQLQLQVQTEEEINAGLSSEVGVLSNNTYLKTGMDTPFMVVFFNPPKNVKEYGVKVIDALDPAQ